MVSKDEMRAKYGRQVAKVTGKAAQLEAAIRKCMADDCPPEEARAVVKLAEAIGHTEIVPKEIVAAAKKQVPAKQREQAFVVTGNTGRTVITAPLREIASKNEGFTYLHGRFVEADRPNRNGAMWSTDDLELAEATVAGGPLNWLHDDQKIIGTLLDGHLVAGREAAAAGLNSHIVSTAAVWRFLFPNETAVIEKAAQENQLWYSMECISKDVLCTGEAGCGDIFPYQTVMRQQACGHLNDRSSVRRFIDPVFLGGAIIVPPVRPGWARADVEVVRQAAGLTEEHALDAELEKPEAQAMVASILTWANRAA
jgi:hypothetical protein